MPYLAKALARIVRNYIGMLDQDLEATELLIAIISAWLLMINLELIQSISGLKRYLDKKVSLIKKKRSVAAISTSTMKESS